MPVVGLGELRHAGLACLAIISALAMAIACGDPQSTEPESEGVVELVKEVEVSVEIETERVVEVVEEVEVPVEIETERVVEVVEEVEVPVEIETERVVEVVEEVEVPVEIQVEPASPPSPGLWAGDLIGEPGQTQFSPPWLAVRIRPGEDPYQDPWRVEVGPSPGYLPPAFLCDLKQRPDGWELSSCTGLVYVDLQIFAPAAEGAVEVTLTSPNFVARGILTRIESRDELQSSDNVEVLWHQPGEALHSDIWAEDGLVFAPRLDGTIEIIDGNSGNILGRATAGNYVLDVKARDGILYAATASSGLQIIDVSDPVRPQPIGEFFAPPHEGFTNFHNIFLSPNGQFVYAINQSEYPKTDLLVIDVSDPAKAVEAGRFSLDTDTASAFNFHDAHDVNVMEVDGRLIAFLNYLEAGLRPQPIGEFFAPPHEGFTNFHNIFLSPNGQFVYAINQSEYPKTDLLVIDVSDPAKAVEAGRFSLDTDTASAFNFHDAHDVNVMEVDGRLIAFLNYLEAGLWILDLTDPQDIVVVGSITWEGIFSHSGWPFRIGERLYYAHNTEGYDAHMTILEVTDLSNPGVVSRFATRRGISIHNVQVERGIAYISYYVDGLRVVDLRDPLSPREIAHFDTVPAENERDILQGAWGVRVLNGNVYVSDIELGTYALRVDVD